MSKCSYHDNCGLPGCELASSSVIQQRLNDEGEFTTNFCRVSCCRLKSGKPSTRWTDPHPHLAVDWKGGKGGPFPFGVDVHKVSVHRATWAFFRLLASINGWKKLWKPAVALFIKSLQPAAMANATGRLIGAIATDPKHVEWWYFFLPLGVFIISGAADIFFLNHFPNGSMQHALRSHVVRHRTRISESSPAAKYWVPFRMPILMRRSTDLVKNLWGGMWILIELFVSQFIINALAFLQIYNNDTVKQDDSAPIPYWAETCFIIVWVLSGLIPLFVFWRTV